MCSNGSLRFATTSVYSPSNTTRAHGGSWATSRRRSRTLVSSTPRSTCRPIIRRQRSNVRRSRDERRLRRIRSLRYAGGMALREVVLVTIAGCSFPHGAASTGDDVPGDDGGTDADAVIIDAPADCTLWTAKHFMPCAIPAPMGDVSLEASLSPYTYTTTTGGGV